VSTVDRDAVHELREAMNDARSRGEALYFRGGNSKRRLLGRHCAASALDVRVHRGIISYRPDEMVITARAGTPLAELESASAARGQRLPFDAAVAEGRATLGGCVASGISAAARPWRGAVRDAVLGLRLLNGRGELLRFGGEVMKNVAGYDVSRLQCGALGSLGLICDVSLRLLPAAPAQRELRLPLPAPEAVSCMRDLARRPLPLSGLCWHEGMLHLRLEGEASSLDALSRDLPPGTEPDPAPPWEALREHTHPAIAQGPLRCADLAPATPPTPGPDPVLIDWAGARRYYGDVGGPQDPSEASVQRLWCGDRDGEALPEPPPPLKTILLRLKAAFDPDRLCNPGRLYPWL